MGMSEYFYMQKGTDVYEWINYPFKKIIRSMKYQQWLEQRTRLQSRADIKMTLPKHPTTYKLTPISWLCLCTEETFWVLKRARGASHCLELLRPQGPSWVCLSLRVASPTRPGGSMKQTKEPCLRFLFFLCVSWMMYNINTLEPNF